MTVRELEEQLRPVRLRPTYSFWMQTPRSTSDSFRPRAASSSKTRLSGAIGGAFHFYGDSGSRLVGELQRNEYARHAREINRRHSRAMVLWGTATVFRVNGWRRLSILRRTVLTAAGAKFTTLWL